jgi:hypothetical protein
MKPVSLDMEKRILSMKKLAKKVYVGREMEFHLTSGVAAPAWPVLKVLLSDQKGRLTD